MWGGRRPSYWRIGPEWRPNRLRCYESYRGVPELQKLTNRRWERMRHNCQRLVIRAHKISFFYKLGGHCSYQRASLLLWCGSAESFLWHPNTISRQLRTPSYIRLLFSVWRIGPLEVRLLWYWILATVELWLTEITMQRACSETRVSATATRDASAGCWDACGVLET